MMSEKNVMIDLPKASSKVSMKKAADQIPTTAAIKIVTPKYFGDFLIISSLLLVNLRFPKYFTLFGRIIKYVTNSEKQPVKNDFGSTENNTKASVIITKDKKLIINFMVVFLLSVQKGCFKVANSFIASNNYINKLIIALIRPLSKLILFLVAIISINSNALCSSLSKSELIRLITVAEITHGIPLGLLRSIAIVESSLKPLAVNIAGQGIVAPNNLAAKSMIELNLKQGKTNIDIGLMQINYRWHKHRFMTVEAMLEPKANIEYAASLIKSLYKEHGSWHKAVRAYHSANPQHYRRYSKRILEVWLKQDFKQVNNSSNNLMKTRNRGKAAC